MQTKLSTILLTALLFVGAPLQAGPQDIDRAVNYLQQAKEALIRDNAASPNIDRVDRLIQDLRSNVSAIDPVNTCQFAVDQVFRDALDRPADPAGLSNYEAQCKRGVTIASIRQEIAHSPEAKGKINDAFRKLLCRDADDEAIRTYTDSIGGGKKLDDVRNAIMTSDEYKNLPPSCRVNR